MNDLPAPAPDPDLGPADDPLLAEASNPATTGARLTELIDDHEMRLDVLEAALRNPSLPSAYFEEGMDDFAYRAMTENPAFLLHALESGKVVAVYRERQRQHLANKARSAQLTVTKVERLSQEAYEAGIARVVTGPCVRVFAQKQHPAMVGATAMMHALCDEVDTDEAERLLGVTMDRRLSILTYTGLGGLSTFKWESFVRLFGYVAQKEGKIDALGLLLERLCPSEVVYRPFAHSELLGGSR